MFQLSTECVDLAREGQEQFVPVRGYLGASALGDDPRINWLRFRLSFPANFPGRMLRLFDLGNAIENDVVASLKAVKGIQVASVHPVTGEQFRVQEFGGHLSGSCDGFIQGYPGAPDGVGILEVKSMNSRRFSEWQAKGMEETNPKYWVQGHMYCKFFRKPYVLFMVYNKDTSELGAEVAEYDETVADAWLAQAERIIFNCSEIPLPGWTRPEEQAAKFAVPAHLKNVYWGKELPPPNCRNCRHSAPLREGGWACSMHGETWEGMELHRGGCGFHNFIPALVDAKMVQVGETWVQYHRNGKDFWNAPQDHENIAKSAWGSAALAAVSKGGYCMQDDPGVKAFSEMFDATVESVTPVWELSDPDVV